MAVKEKVSEAAKAVKSTAKKDYKTLGEDFFQKLSKICEIIDK